MNTIVSRMSPDQVEAEDILNVIEAADATTMIV